MGAGDFLAGGASFQRHYLLIRDPGSDESITGIHDTRTAPHQDAESMCVKKGTGRAELPLGMHPAREKHTLAHVGREFRGVDAFH